MVTTVRLNKPWLNGSADREKSDRSAWNVTDRFVQLPRRFILGGPLVSRVSRVTRELNLKLKSK